MTSSICERNFSDLFLSVLSKISFDAELNRSQDKNWDGRGVRLHSHLPNGVGRVLGQVCLKAVGTPFQARS